MLYIIDANNLAGKLGILFEDNFDKKLIDIIKNWSKRKNQIYLIFDGVDFMGDKYTEDNITIIHTPKDFYYASADDKVVEIAKKLLASRKEEIRVVTDDLGIIKKMENIIDNKLKITKATEFAKKISSRVNDSTEPKSEVNEEEADKINRELLEIWK
ncbi:NYN domain-containing protein [Candidatus Parcubacteria bacterium]|nr:NYN domain-containing protein [Candidatus Parcubacteria bacterium]